MYVVEVIPLKKGILLDTLSYFTTIDYEPGTIITVPVRNSTAPAVVLASREASGAKTALRAATFSLRKLPPQPEAKRLAPGLMATATKLHAEYPYALGTILFALLPSEVRNGAVPFPTVYSDTPVSTEVNPPELLSGTTASRRLSHRSLIRNTFAHGGSVLFVVPTVAHIEPTLAELESGITERIFALATGPAKAQREAHAAYLDCSKAKVIVTTPTHAFLDRHDITTIIIEHARSQHYSARTQPYLDYRHALTTYAKLTGKRIILADTVPRSEEEHLLRTGRYLPYDEHPKRLDIKAKLSYIERPKREDGRRYELITGKATEHIDQVIAQRRNVFIYAPRRGLAPIVLCSDCGYIFRCEDSGAPYTLMKTGSGDEEKRWFVTKTTGTRVAAADVCPSCGSWKLRELGIGIQKVYEEVRSLFPGATVCLFDSETAKTPKKAALIMKRFYESKGGILIGTSMAFPYLAAPVHTCIVSSLEAVRATPTWRSQEEFFSLLIGLRELATDSLLVQGKEPPDEAIELAKKGMLEQFYTEELALRQILNYPPFTRFVHLTWRGKPAAGKAFGEKLKQQFSDYTLRLYADPVPTSGITTFYALIRLAESDWPDKALIERLRNLPPSVRVMLNPDRII